MKDGLPLGAPPAGAAARPRSTPREGRPRVPDRLGADGRGSGCAAGAPEGRDERRSSGTSSPCACSDGDNLTGVEPPLIIYSNHSSHLDATLIMCTLPDVWQAKTAVGAARDYFFDVWWRQAFTALVYGAFPIDRARRAKGAIDKARELLSEGWSIVVFPEGRGRRTATCNGSATAPRGSRSRPAPAWPRSRSSARPRRCRRAGAGRAPAGRPSRSATASRSGRRKGRRTRSCPGG